MILIMELCDTIVSISAMTITILDIQVGELTFVIYTRFRLLMVNRLQKFQFILMWGVDRKHFRMMSHILLGRD